MILALVLLIAQAEGPDETARQRDAMRLRVEEDRGRANTLLKEESTIIGALVDLDRALDKAHKRAKAVKKERDAVKTRITAAELGLAENERALMKLRERVVLRADAMMRLKRTSLASLLASRGLAEGRRLKDALRLVVSYDAGLVREVAERRAKARTLAETLRAEGKALAEKEVALAEEIAGEAALRVERIALLKAVQTERKSIEQIAREIARQARSLDMHVGLIHGLVPMPAPRPGGFGEQRGRLPWPVVGTLEAPYGKRVDVNSRVVFDSSGIDVRAPFGDEVKAVFEGKVVYADVFEGFGRLVIVSHPGGFYSLYGHLDEIRVAPGDELERLAVVGTLGESGSSKGAYLYFAIRRNRAPVDPLVWLGP